MSFARKVARRARRRELKQPGVGNMRVKCPEHGKKPWRGNIVCAKCNEIHLIDVETGLHPTVTPQGVCPCGVQLFPFRDENGEVVKAVTFWARIACRDCAEQEHAKRINGRS